MRESEITAFRTVPGKFTTINGPKELLKEMYIPAKYNKQSKLTAELKPGNNENINFDLVSR